ncbi:IS607 family transposase [Helicobacter pylori]|uniref:IS607 family transposase n=1 Tax=Helicobacter pylori TaxID=210 RepID=UPI000F4DDB32|nr:IS607 family transposase [Helicobacter pylori]RPF62633.1 IS607 family transposase [Helicobacter pylori]
MYSPAKFASMIGKSVRTLQRWDLEGVFVAHRNQKNRRFYTHDQYLEYLGIKASEDNLEKFCLVNGYAVSEWCNEVGSGLNYKRKIFNRILEEIEMGKISKLVIAHKDRFVRFGFEYFESFAQTHGCEIIIMNQISLSPEAEMTQDLLSIIHCFSSRLYGLRKYNQEIKEHLKNQE